MQEKAHFHFIGLGGIGMSGLAKILLTMQSRIYSISGSDTQVSRSYIVDDLQRKGAIIYQGHSAENIPDKTTHVVVSSDIAPNNCELMAAQKKKLVIWHRSDLLHMLMKEKENVILVTGTHGKTTTSALLSHVLEYANIDPSYAVGGIMKNYDTNAKAGSSPFFVAEADESDGTFTKYTPQYAIVTNIDTDHLAHFTSLSRLQNSFFEFCRNCPDHSRCLYINGDDSTLVAVAPSAFTYGMHSSNDAVITNICFYESGISFDLFLKQKNQSFSSIVLPLYGEHNAMNAAAVFSMCCALGIEEEIIRTAFIDFQGVRRRLDAIYCGYENRVTVFDDYAHHPTEIIATLQAIKKSFPERRCVVVFQPHRPSRIKYILDEFASAFSDADALFITDLYTASEEETEVQKLQLQLIEIIQKSHIGIEISATPQDQIVHQLHQFARPFDIVIFMGAGNSTYIASDFKEILEKQPIHKYRVGLIYGGMNSENKISRVSAQTIWNNLSPHLFEKKAFLIEVDGVWHTTAEIQQEKIVSDKNKSQMISSAVFEALHSCDIFFPVLHGPFGEDGTIQGFFETIGKPYVGSNHAASAISMDKSFSKKIAEHAQVPVLPYVTIRKYEWEEDAKKCIEVIHSTQLQLPVFIKPVHLGSSVGVHKVEQWSMLVTAVEHAFEVDDKILVEQGLSDFREIEFALLGNDVPFVPPPGEVEGHGQFYSYQAKYGKNSFVAKPYTDLAEEVIQCGCYFAKKVFQEIDNSGAARIDFLLGKDNSWYFNEINPMPGFTAISVYPSVLHKAGVMYPDLINKLIKYGFHRFAKVRRTAIRATQKGVMLELDCAISQ